MVFDWSLSDSKSLQVSRTHLSILVNLNNAVVWMVSPRPLISKSSSPCTNLLVTLPSQLQLVSPSLSCSIVFSSLESLGTYISFCIPSILPCGQPDSKVPYSTGSLFCWLSLGLVVCPRLGDQFVSQYPREFCTSHFPGRFLDCVCTICLYGWI